MFHYSLRTKIFIAMALVSALLIVLIVVSDGQRKSKDLLLVSQSKALAVAWERYYDKFNAYPDLEKMSVSNLQSLTDQGVNNPEGKIIYYQKDFVWAGPATIASRADNYSIEFELNNKWPIWNLNSRSGGYCRITANMVMQCASDN